MWGDRSRCLLRCENRKHLKLREVGPIRHPLVEECSVVAIHHLKAALEVSRDPARYIAHALGRHAPLLLKTAVDRLCIAISKVLDHHEKHQCSSSAVGWVGW